MLHPICSREPHHRQLSETHNVSKKSDKSLFYFRFDAELIEPFDRRIQRLGYTSRTDFFTAVAYAVLLGIDAFETSDLSDISANGKYSTSDKNPDTPSLPLSLKTWLGNTIPQISEEQILSDLQTIIRENLVPVIAMKGKDIAFASTWKDIRAIYREQTGIWVTESDLREAYTAFDAVNRTELTRYREEQMENRTNQE